MEAHRESPPDEVGAGQVKLGQGPGDLFLLGTAANSTAELGHHHDAKGKIVKGEENRYLFIGNSTEAALLEFTQVVSDWKYRPLHVVYPNHPVLSFVFPVRTAKFLTLLCELNQNVCGWKTSQLLRSVWAQSLRRLSDKMAQLLW